MRENKKRDLLLIADFFRVSILKAFTKQIIKADLFGKLVKAGILPGHADGSVGEQPEATVKTVTKEVLPKTGTEKRG